MKLKGRKAIITGAGGGIGGAIALAFAQNGCDCLISDIDLESAEAVATKCRKIGREALPMKADVANRADVDSIIKKGVEAFGTIDIMVTVAGVLTVSPFHQLPKKDWDWLMAVHVDGTFYCLQAILPEMIRRKYGRIITISSVAGITGLTGCVHYSAMKGALIGLTKALAKEVVADGITINSIAPGPIDTRMNDKLGEEVKKQLIAETPVGRLGKPEDVAYWCVYLASEESSFATGQIVNVSGGYTIA
jgi:3-oxoacyl-[acyl-carrier protein] reductase